MNGEGATLAGSRGIGILGAMAIEASPVEDNLLKAQRHERILVLLKESGQVHATALGEAFSVSGYTIRRDLDELAEAGLLKRVHGGAVLASPVGKTYDERQRQGLAEKKQSATAALSRLRENQLVLVDGGSTAALFAETVPVNYPATFVTHSPSVAGILIARAPAEVVVVGGRLDPFSRVAVGAATVQAYARLSADLCVLGLSGLNAGQGVFTPYYEESLVRAAMIDAANEVVALAIADKLGTGGAFQVAPTSALTHLAVEDDTPAALTRPFEEIGLKVLRRGGSAEPPISSSGAGASPPRPELNERS
jgi:DeoR/GlpR family transcriptional regulator of sugar metabolism